MKAFGFLSFGHYGSIPGSGTRTASDMLHQTVEIAQAADQIGVNGAYVRVHHWARQAATPWPLLAAMAAKTERIEVGTGVIDMRYENPLQMAEEAATVELLARGRVALGVSRGSPETAHRGYEAFGYTGSKDPRGADIATDKFDEFLRAIQGERIATADPSYGTPGTKIAIEPRSETLLDKIWWGTTTIEGAERTGKLGLNMMSSTLLAEATGKTFAELQAEQIERFREAYKAAGHQRVPRVSVSRSVFPLVTAQDHQYFGVRGEGADQIGVLDGLRSTFGKTYADTPDRLIEQLRQDPAVMSADTLMLTIPNQLGAEYNIRLLQSFAEHVAPELGWIPNTQGPVTGYPL